MARKKNNFLDSKEDYEGHIEQLEIECDHLRKEHRALSKDMRYYKTMYDAYYTLALVVSLMLIVIVYFG